MIKNLVVSGCSFTQKLGWGQEILNVSKQDFNQELKYTNLSKSGAGNFYIADSLIYLLSSNQFDPAETLVMVMWSGVSRKDVTVSKEFYEMINVVSNSVKQDSGYYAISGGQIGTWQSELFFPRGKAQRWFLRPLFENLYKSSDHASMAHDTLTNIVRLKDFLEIRNYSYKFMSYVNYWGNSKDYLNINLDFDIPYYAPSHPLLQHLGNEWIWADDKKNCVYEYSKKLNLLDEDEFHPTTGALIKFTHQHIIPSIKGFFP